MPLYNKTENFDYLEEKWFEEYYKLKVDFFSYTRPCHLILPPLMFCILSN